jgi:3-deoxy-D-manno-octulosonic-acid transferase
VPFVRKTSGVPVSATTQVVLGDSMGEMLAYCAAADVVFVGGSLLPFGGQNLIEPIAVGAPVIVGPHTFNFADATAGAIAAGAALRVPDAEALIMEVRALLADAGRRVAMREAGHAFYDAHRGAGERLWEWLAPRLDAAGLASEPASPVASPRARASPSARG